ncbi:low affinity iron permease family protein [Comamonas sp.]|uniref:low affinity iron permease family protein n=1 Tax=Comamonas sp. TaxID=34028 RepID=UPI0028AAB1E8|nr:low affinity iron permease family protein [Comamonas sp.]
MSQPTEFSKVSRYIAKFSGNPKCFALACFLVIAWAVTGPIFHFNNTWQLVINTGTTIITFLMVFLIQATQNSDTTAMQIKLDELIRAIEGAQNSLLSVEDLEPQKIDELKQKFDTLGEEARIQNPEYSNS